MYYMHITRANGKSTFLKSPQLQKQVRLHFDHTHCATFKSVCRLLLLLLLSSIIIIIIIIIEFLTSQLWLGNIHLSWDVAINRIRLGGLICSLKSFLQLNMCQELQIFAVVYMYWGVYYYYWCYSSKYCYRSYPASYARHYLLTPPLCALYWLH